MTDGFYAWTTADELGFIDRLLASNRTKGLNYCRAVLKRERWGRDMDPEVIRAKAKLELLGEARRRLGMA